MVTKVLAAGSAMSQWSDSAAWIPSAAPTAADDVVLNGRAVALNGPQGVNSLALYGAAGAGFYSGLTLYYGSSLTAASGVTLASGALTLFGTLHDTTLHMAGGTVVGSGTMSNVVIDGTDTVGTGGGGTTQTLTVQNSIRLSSANAPGLVLIAGGRLMSAPGVPYGPGSYPTATVDGGLLVAGGTAAAPAALTGATNVLILGPSLFTDVTGYVMAQQSAGLTRYSVVNQGTILVGPGATLAADASLTGPGSIHLASGTLDLTAQYSGASAGPIVMDDAKAVLLLPSSGTVGLTGFRAGDRIDVKSTAVTQPVLVPTSGGAPARLTAGRVTIILPDAQPGATYAAASDGAGGEVITTTATGPATPASYAIAASGTANVFTVTRSGDTGSAAVLHFAVTGTGTGPAAAADFVNGVLPTGTVTFATGETSKSITVAPSATPAGADGYTVTLSGDAGTALGQTTAAGAVSPAAHGTVGLVNGTTGLSSAIALDAAGAGGPNYLQGQYIYAGSDGVAMATGQAGVFLHGGSGNDALSVTSGQNVLDGGIGSNFLTGGTGQDTFFTDARGAGVVWNTVVNFHSGDAVTLWGFVAGVSSYTWDATPGGAAGATGATLRANIVGGAGRTGNGIDASVTFAGLSVDQGKALLVATGTQPAGSYLYLRAG